MCRLAFYAIRCVSPTSLIFQTFQLQFWATTHIIIYRYIFIYERRWLIGVECECTWWMHEKWMISSWSLYRKWYNVQDIDPNSIDLETWVWSKRKTTQLVAIGQFGRFSAHLGYGQLCYLKNGPVNVYSIGCILYLGVLMGQASLAHVVKDLGCVLRLICWTLAFRKLSCLVLFFCSIFLFFQKKRKKKGNIFG